MEKKRVPYKFCFVPCCKSTTTRNPEKLFFTVPRKEPDRSKWLKIVRRDLKSLKSNFTCCEDHFNKEDFENYEYVQLFKKKGVQVKLRIKNGVLPSMFDCQTSRLIAKHSRKSVMEKLNGQKMVQEISSNVDNLMDIQRTFTENSDSDKEDGLNTHVIIKEEPFDENFEIGEEKHSDPDDGLNTHVIIKEEQFDEYFEINEEKPNIDFETEENPICDMSKKILIKQEPIEDSCYNIQTINHRNNKSKLIANKSKKDCKKIDTLVYNISSHLKKNLQKLSPEKRTTLINSLNNTINEFMKNT